MGTSRPSVYALCCMHLYTSPLPENASLRTNQWTIDLFRSRHPVWKKEFGAKPSEKKMMMKRKMRRLEAKPEHESRSIQRVSSRCKWTNNYQYLMYKFILPICNPIRCFENSTCMKIMLILNDKFFLHVFDIIIWLVICRVPIPLWYWLLPNYINSYPLLSRVNYRIKYFHAWKLRMLSSGIIYCTVSVVSKGHPWILRIIYKKSVK